MEIVYSIEDVKGFFESIPQLISSEKAQIVTVSQGQEIISGDTEKGKDISQVVAQ